MKRRFTVQKQVTRRRSGVITIADLRDVFSIPEHAKVVVDIPSGGDYSGQELDVTEIRVSWEETK